MFGLNHRSILIQYPRWSAEGFGETIEILIARLVKLLETGMAFYRAAWNADAV